MVPDLVECPIAPCSESGKLISLPNCKPRKLLEQKLTDVKLQLQQLRAWPHSLYQPVLDTASSSIHETCLWGEPDIHTAINLVDDSMATRYFLQDLAATLMTNTFDKHGISHLIPLYLSMHAPTLENGARLQCEVQMEHIHRTPDCQVWLNFRAKAFLDLANKTFHCQVKVNSVSGLIGDAPIVAATIPYFTLCSHNFHFKEAQNGN